MNSQEDNSNHENNTSQAEVSYTQYLTQDTSSAASENAAPKRASVSLLLSHPAHFFSLGFGSGLSPLAPGTVGTLYAWLSFIVLNRYLDATAWAALLCVGLVAGVWLTGYTARSMNTSDPSAIVWDEIVAFWLVLWLITPASLLAQVVAFALFRYFDAAKPGPVGWADRRFKGGLGIMLDDLIAAGCTLFVIALWQRLFTA